MSRREDSVSEKYSSFNDEDELVKQIELFHEKYPKFNLLAVCNDAADLIKLGSEDFHQVINEDFEIGDFIDLLTKVLKGYSNIESLDISGILSKQEYDERAYNKLFVAIACHLNIRSVSAFSCHLTDASASSLAGTIFRNKESGGKLSQLNLIDNKFSDEGVMYIMDAIQQNEKMRRIWLSYNEFTSAGIRYILSSVRNTCLIECEIKTSAFEEFGLDDLQKIMESNKIREETKEDLLAKPPAVISDVTIEEMNVAKDGPFSKKAIKPHIESEVDLSIKFENHDPFRRQIMLGVGAAMTESSARNLKHSDNYRAILEKLFSQDHIGINVVRVPIGASDFSIHEYTYEDNRGEFQLGESQNKFIIPCINDALGINPEIKIIATPWSAPAWMKENNELRGGTLREEYYPHYAEYLGNFVSAYEEQGISVYALTIQNEPLHDTCKISMYGYVKRGLY